MEAVAQMPVQEAMTLAEGWLTWVGEERITDRYGSVWLQDATSLPVTWGPLPDPGTPGKLWAVVLATRKSKHPGDLFRGFVPTTPEPGERILLGEGRFFVESPGYEGIHCVGLRPEPPPENDWLIPMALYRAHDQYVRLQFEATGPSPFDNDFGAPRPEGPDETEEKAKE